MSLLLFYINLSRLKLDFPSFILNNIPIVPVSQLRYLTTTFLELVFDQCLTWTNHIDIQKLKTETTKLLDLLKTFRNPKNNPNRNLLLVYRDLIRSKIDYMSFYQV